MMSVKGNKDAIESYGFHHIDTSKCKACTTFDCEKACFRGIYEVINKKAEPKCVVVEEREEMCVKCHLCTSSCKHEAITID
ncbi:MAG: 4Fe-4S dicluster domain-containing protein [Promethearchaeota archaeon]